MADSEFREFMTPPVRRFYKIKPIVQKQARHSPFPGPSQPLHPAGSVLLDIVRFGAALAVGIGHIFPGMLNIALSAVAIFFVLSGFVIRLITTARRTSAHDYAIDRVSRIYSVTLPAIALTLLVATCLHFFPGRRSAPLELAPLQTAYQVLANTLFFGSIWSLDVPVSFNNVFWSLCYECVYYVLYGFLFFGNRLWRWLPAVALVLFAGPPILFMLPLWLFGCLLHDVYQYLRGFRRSGLWLTLALSTAALIAVALRQSLHSIALEAVQWSDLGALSALAHAHHLHLLKRASFHAYVVGIPAGLLVLCGLLLLEPAGLHKNHWFAVASRRVADSTFTFYLFHLCFVWMVWTYLPFRHGNIALDVALLLGTAVACYFLTPPIDALKRQMRRRASVPGEASRQIVSP